MTINAGRRVMPQINRLGPSCVCARSLQRAYGPRIYVRQFTWSGAWARAVLVTSRSITRACKHAYANRLSCIRCRPAGQPGNGISIWRRRYRESAATRSCTLRWLFSSHGHSPLRKRSDEEQTWIIHRVRPHTFGRYGDQAHFCFSLFLFLLLCFWNS